MPQVEAVARRTAPAYAALPEVEAVVMGGSEATGLAEPGADVDRSASARHEAWRASPAASRVTPPCEPRLLQVVEASCPRRPSALADQRLALSAAAPHAPVIQAAGGLGTIDALPEAEGLAPAASRLAS